jgi:hypothetical protein
VMVVPLLLARATEVGERRLEQVSYAVGVPDERAFADEDERGMTRPLDRLAPAGAVPARDVGEDHAVSIEQATRAQHGPIVSG